MVNQRIHSLEDIRYRSMTTNISNWSKTIFFSHGNSRFPVYDTHLSPRLWNGKKGFLQFVFDFGDWPVNLPTRNPCQFQFPNRWATSQHQEPSHPRPGIDSANVASLFGSHPYLIVVVCTIQTYIYIYMYICEIHSDSISINTCIPHVSSTTIR